MSKRDVHDRSDHQKQALRYRGSVREQNPKLQCARTLCGAHPLYLRGPSSRPTTLSLIHRVPTRLSRMATLPAATLISPNQFWPHFVCPADPRRQGGITQAAHVSFSSATCLRYSLDSGTRRRPPTEIRRIYPPLTTPKRPRVLTFILFLAAVLSTITQKSPIARLGSAHTTYPGGKYVSLFELYRLYAPYMLINCRWC